MDLPTGSLCRGLAERSFHPGSSSRERSQRDRRQRANPELEAPLHGSLKRMLGTEPERPSIENPGNHQEKRHHQQSSSVDSAFLKAKHSFPFERLQIIAFISKALGLSSNTLFFLPDSAFLKKQDFPRSAILERTPTFGNFLPSLDEASIPPPSPSGPRAKLGGGGSC